MIIEDYSDKRVAILAVHSPTGEAGGAERFHQDLFQAIKRRVGYAELISLPCDESTFDSIMKSYDEWKHIDLSSFDVVVSTKAPSYNIIHPRHIVYLQHTIRVFYDMFDDVFPQASSELQQQRKRIQKIDTYAFKNAFHRFTIGHEVLKRLHEWNNIDADVMHHPICQLEGLHPGTYGDYFFLPGRLHAWKRVDLAISAVKASRLPNKLLISGTGEAEKKLKSLAGNDPRIEFLGRITDEELVEKYANALAIIFIPIREDYGLVTLEAFKSGKPVLTCTDSGEPLQFVMDGKSGFVCDPNPESLSLAMHKLIENKAVAESMGLEGMRITAHITWENVANRLLSAAFGTLTNSCSPAHKQKKKVAIFDMQPIDPPVGGGRLRLMGLYHALGENFEAKYVGTYDWPGEKYRQQMLSSNLEEIDVPLSQAHHDAAAELSLKAEGKVVIDLAFPMLGHLSLDYLQKARLTAAWAEIVIFSHPWVFPLIEKDLKSTHLVVYDSHNVEGYLRAQLLNENNPVEAHLLRETVKAEYTLGKRADLILACSQEDIDLFAKIYDLPFSKIRLLPNGVMVSKITQPSLNEKIKAKKSVGLSDDRPAAIFIGSNYKPNIQAADYIISQLCAELPHIDFVIAGGVGTALSINVPKNVKVTGSLDEKGKLLWLHACDIAINPMFSGSGTNIKMFDFMAAGLPIVSTPTGARGIAKTSKAALFLASSNHFVAEMGSILSGGRLPDLGHRNRQWVEREFAWEKLSPQLGLVLLDHERNRETRRFGPVKDVNRKLRLAHITTAGHLCGIGEYTLKLIKYLPKDLFENFIVTCETPGKFPTLQLPDANVCVGWYYDNDKWCNSSFKSDMFLQLHKWNVDAVLLQYHSGFFSELALEKLTNRLLSDGLKVAITIHNLSLCDLNVLSRLDRAGVTLLSHSHREIEQAKIHGIILTFLPLGVDHVYSSPLKSINDRQWYKQPPIVSTTGFLRHHKGLRNLIEAIFLLQSAFPGSKLMAQCALYPSDDSREELIRVKELIKKLNMGNSIILVTDFLPIEHVYERIKSTDIAVLPYLQSDEGGSATAATCLTAGLPLVLSDVPIFHELKGVACLLENTDPQTIATALIQIFRSPEDYARLCKLGYDYRKTHSWDQVSKRLSDILTKG